MDRRANHSLRIAFVFATALAGEQLPAFAQAPQATPTPRPIGAASLERPNCVTGLRVVSAPKDGPYTLEVADARTNRVVGTVEVQNGQGVSSNWQVVANNQFPGSGPDQGKPAFAGKVTIAKDPQGRRVVGYERQTNAPCGQRALYELTKQSEPTPQPTSTPELRPTAKPEATSIPARTEPRTQIINQNNQTVIIRERASAEPAPSLEPSPTPTPTASPTASPTPTPGAGNGGDGGEGEQGLWPHCGVVMAMPDVPSEIYHTPVPVLGPVLRVLGDVSSAAGKLLHDITAPTGWLGDRLGCIR